jgi:hypothetical protein
MAEILNEFAFRQGGNGAGSKHPWNEWMDGRIHKLSKDDMGNASLQTMAASAHRNAKARGKKVRMSINKSEGTIVLQAYVPEPVQNGNGEAEAEHPTATATGEPANGATAEPGNGGTTGKRTRKGAKAQHQQ